MNNTKRLPWLDWIRFSAAFIVLVVHARGGSFVAFGDLPDEQRNTAALLFFAATRFGTEAVTLFFVLSGYLVGGKLIERVQSGSFDVMTYSVDRLTRLYLPLIPAIVLTAAIGVLIGEPVPVSQLAGNLANLQGIAVSPPALNGPLWSLSYEFWFYILGGALAFALIRQSGLAFFLSCAVLCLFTFLSPFYLMSWVIGALAYRVRVRKSALMLSFAIVLVCFGVIGMQLSSGTRSVAFLQTIMSNEVSIIVLSAGIALLIQQVSQMRHDGWLAKVDLFGAKPAAFSYTLYLTHYPIVMAAPHYGFGQAASISLGSILVFLSKIGFCLLVAWMIYMVSERHTDAVRRFLRKGKTRIVPVEGDAAL